MRPPPPEKITHDLGAGIACNAVIADIERNPAAQSDHRKCFATRRNGALAANLFAPRHSDSTRAMRPGPQMKEAARAARREAISRLIYP